MRIIITFLAWIFKKNFNLELYLEKIHEKFFSLCYLLGHLIKRSSFPNYEYILLKKIQLPNDLYK